MIFTKSENPIRSESVSFDAFFRDAAYSLNQFVYALPDTPTLLWYENRDRGHANAQGFDNVVFATPSVSAWGLNRNDVYKNGIVLSNSSTALDSTETQGSNTRATDQNWGGWFLLREMWESGTIQFFPEHKDYDGFDWFKINQPYIVTTQGSSGSELNELHRCRDIVNALSAELKRWLIDNKRVGDVLSYLMRSNTRFDYLDPINHRVVVDGGNTTQADIDLAKSITIDNIPPRLSIHVISDSNDIRDSRGLPLTSTIRTSELAGFQRIDGTPARTIAVEIRSDKPCEIHWIKSQGDCTITYQSTDKRKAMIAIPHQANFTVQTQSGDIVSNRVEVIAIGFDGTHYSSPVFMTEYFTPSARDFRKKMNEIAVHADNAFELKLNGEVVLRGDNWQSRYEKRDVAWKESNTVDVKVTNAGGPGGLLAEMFVGEAKYITDDSWECSLDQVNWTKPTVIPHQGSVWQFQSNISPKLNWLWHHQAGEQSTVYFRKQIGATVPEPTPQPSDLEQRVAALETTIAKIREALK